MTMITINMDSPFVANVRGNEYSIDVAGWDAAGYARVFEYGLQRIHNDACGGIKRDECASDAEYVKLVLDTAADVTEALRSGTKRTRVGGGRVADPVKRMAREMALDVLRTTLRGKKVKIESLDKAKVSEWIKDYLDRNPAVTAKAEARVAEQAAMAEGADFDLGSLMGAPDAE